MLIETFCTRKKENDYFIADIHIDGYIPVGVQEFGWMFKNFWGRCEFIDNGYQINVRNGVMKAYTSTPVLVHGFIATIVYMKAEL